MRYTRTISARITRKFHRHWKRSRTGHRLALFAGLVAAAAGIRPKPVRILVMSDGVVGTSEQQFAPMIRHGRALAARLGVVVQYEDTAFAEKLTREGARAYSAIVLKLGFRTEANQARVIAQHLAECRSGTSCRLIYFDGEDDSRVEWPDVISAVDSYVKKHVLADSTAYGLGMVGKSNLTDYVARQHGTSFADDIIPRCDPLSPEMIDKVNLGWNIGLDDKIFDLSLALSRVTMPPRDIDLLCRAHAPESDWTHPLRASANAAVEALANRYKVRAPRERVPLEEYYDELLRSRICVSPFGYGEFCWRDFESVLCGALLVKADVSHLRTEPNLFWPGETYVPVRWDYADLEAACAPYLADESRRQQVAERARLTLMNALQEDWFVERFAHILHRAGVTV